MTDEAPNEIWANREAKDSGLSFMGKIEHRTWDYDNTYGNRGVTHHYTLTTHTLALVAEAYEVAAKGTEAKVGPHVHPQSLTAAVLLDLAKATRALTPADAIAAREARDTEVREQALREAADRLRIMGDLGGMEIILALIKKDKTNDG